MKKTLLLSILSFTTVYLSAQIYQGQWMVGGNGSFTSSSQGDGDENKYSTIELNPNVGYFVINNLAIGARINFASIKPKEADDAFVDLLAGPFIRYYFLPAERNINIFADASASFGNYGSNDKLSQNQFAVMAGPAIFLNEHAALEIALKYGSRGGDLYDDPTGDDDREGSLGINIGFQIHLGSGSGKNK